MARPPKTTTALPVEAQSEAYSPPVATNESPQSPPPKLPPTPPFLLAFHPERWTVMRSTVIPSLRKWPLQAGFNGIEQTSDGKLRIREPQAKAEERRLTLIPHDVDGPKTSYIKRPKGTVGVHLVKFERVYPGSTQIDCDEPGYVAWCRSLIDRKVIPHPQLHVLERMYATVLRQVEELVGKNGSESLLKRLQGDMKAIEGEIESARKREAVAAAADENVDASKLTAEE